MAAGTARVGERGSEGLRARWHGVYRRAAAAGRAAFYRGQYRKLTDTRDHRAYVGRWVCLYGALAVFLPIGSLARPPRQMSAVPGLMRIIPSTHHPILFFGEYHGSNQSPAFFGDAVTTVSEFRPVLVILEQNQSEARLVSNYVSGRLSMAGVVSSGEWLWASRDPQHREDGRHSIAMVKLLYLLRQLRQSGRVIRIGGTNADKLPAHVHYNAEMAENIRRLSKGFAGVTMVYTGTAHARMQGRQAANLLPSRRTVSITTVPAGRTVVNSLWVCRMKKGAIFCGPHEFRHEHLESPAKYCGPMGIHRSSARRIKKTGFDAYACVGEPITESPPATLANEPAWRRWN